LCAFKEKKVLDYSQSHNLVVQMSSGLRRQMA